MKHIFLFITMICITHLGMTQLREVSLDVGINHLHNTPIMMGGGTVLFDYNNDGFVDIYATDAANHDKLYQNFGDGTFFDVSAKTNIRELTNDYYSFGVIAGDINNDGCDDLFIATYGKDENSLLLLNNCDGTFSDISISAGIVEKTSSSGAIFIDYNMDGLLDIYVINYIDEFVFIKDENDIIIDIDRTCLPNLFYINQGNNVFIERAAEYQIDNLGCGLSVLATDYDYDGDQDIYIANDHGMFVVPNTMYRNNYPEHSFTDVSEEYGFNAEMFGMGIAAGDYDENGFDNYYVSNLGNNIMLSSEDGQNYFNTAPELEIENGYYDNDTSVTSWGTFFVDFDNDTDLDLFVVNGYIRTGFFGFTTTLDDKNKMFENDGSGTFADLSAELGVDDPWIGRGGAYADYDRNGSVDFFIVNTSDEENGHSLLYKNEFAGNNWIEFNLEGSGNSNRNGFGSLVTVYSGENTMKRELSSGGSHASQHSQILHFGVALADQVDSVEVRWPDGENEIFYSVSSNNIYYLRKGTHEMQVEGCTDSESINYDPNATYSTACNRTKIVGCTDLLADNFNETANFDDGTCNYVKDEQIILGTMGRREGNIVLHPNPIIDHLTIENVIPENQLKTIIIYNANSKVIYKNDSWGSEQIKINTSFLTSGLYIVKIIDKKSGKIIFYDKLLKIE
jgi:enediyne biosynthesis protein E4